MQSTLSELNSTLLDAMDNSEDIWQQRIIALNSSLHQRIHSLESALDERDEQIANLYTLLRNLNSTVSGLKNFVTYGQSASDPGTSCKDILDRYHKLGESVVPSQNYWIKNPSTSPAFQVFCDMVRGQFSSSSRWFPVSFSSHPLHRKPMGEGGRCSRPLRP